MQKKLIIPALKDQVQRHLLLYVMLAALLTTALLMLLARLPAVIDNKPESIPVNEQNGVYDLSGLENIEDAVIQVSPSETYYPNLFLTPEDVETAVPERIEHYGELRADYLSQRFVLKLPDNGDVYALTFKLSGRHAMRVYVNGKLAGQTGKLGTTKQDTEVWENNMTCYAAPEDGKMDIILHSAQFYHAKRGASLAQLDLIKMNPDIKNSFSSLTKGLLIMGALLCAALFLFCIFLLQPGTKVTLYFTMACLVMVLRECLQSQAWTYFSFIPGNLSFMLEYLSVVLLTIFLSLYLGQYAVNRFLRVFQYGAILGSCVYGLCLLFTDSVFYTSILKYYQALLVVCIICGVTGLFWTMRRPTREQAAALFGIAVFYLAAVGDILMYSNIFGEEHPNTPISEAALLVFVLAQTVSLFLMNNRTMAESKASEQKLAAEKEALENLNRMKTEFLGNISHELKTPLTVISSHAQQAENTLPEKPELEEAARSMRLIEGETARMALMVSQLLDASRIDEGRMVIEKKQEFLVEIIQAMLDNYYPVFSKNHNTLYFKKCGDIPLVLCDRNRITQVLVNLITNAARHTREGKITVSISAETDEVTVTVSDTGEGIAPHRLSHLFERYYSRHSGLEDNSTASAVETGTGLGLYICKYIVEAHGGTIRVESAPGTGTDVRFTLPAEKFPIQAP